MGRLCGEALVYDFPYFTVCHPFDFRSSTLFSGTLFRKLLFVRQVLRLLFSGKGMPCFPVFKDNRGAVQLAQNLITNSNSKHIDIHRSLLQ